MDDLSAPPSKSAVSTFFMRLSQRYQSLLGNNDKIIAFLKNHPAHDKESRERSHSHGLECDRDWLENLRAIDFQKSSITNSSTNYKLLALSSFSNPIDKSTPHTKARWIAAFVNLGLFLTRIITAQGWYIVTYALGIYHLNLFIAFLTPKIDPSMDLDSGKFDRRRRC